MTDMYKDFSKWLDGFLDKGIPAEAVAANFNIYEDSVRNHIWSIQLIFTDTFNPDDEDWACEEIFTTGEDLFTWDTDLKWQDALTAAELLVKEYLENGSHAEELKALQAVGTGFVDGDVSLVYMAEDEHEQI